MYTSSSSNSNSPVPRRPVGSSPTSPIDVAQSAEHEYDAFAARTMYLSLTLSPTSATSTQTQNSQLAYKHVESGYYTIKSKYRIS
ncbi:hypothetical protein LshimejAT787_2200460 [Lyophyllum shimeji]|uniref:Uncharacterized protein n=1 Tax=Lyophyllum shimeji TaxID=47721 RepID=A0A9P3UU94_LYOSH|nr:hypothetical protein LshimejAT787_2200460 [Lyophyllum shimeji]